jgi:hypothetical protein
MNLSKALLLIALFKRRLSFLRGRRLTRRYVWMTAAVCLAIWSVLCVAAMALLAAGGDWLIGNANPGGMLHTGVAHPLRSVMVIAQTIGFWLIGIVWLVVSAGAAGIAWLLVRAAEFYRALDPN